MKPKYNSIHNTDELVKIKDTSLLDIGRAENCAKVSLKQRKLTKMRNDEIWAGWMAIRNKDDPMTVQTFLNEITRHPDEMLYQILDRGNMFQLFKEKYMN